MKEKLIELLMSAERNAEEQGFFNCHRSKAKAECIADYLLANGVIPIPCKVGDTVYAFCEMLGVILEYKVVGIGITEIAMQYEAYAYTKEEDILIDNIDYETDDIGKTIFLTREEAEKALREREQNEETY